MAVNYNDSRFAMVEMDKQQALSELEQTYAGMIGESDQYYQAQIDASKQWADKQSALQQEQTDFTIEQIEQQKEQTQKDYTKEQSGAYVDWQKQSGQYGVNAENMAAAGLYGSGFSESAQVSMYNTYQNRVAVARESYNNAVLNYNNAIKDARLQNNSVLAEIAYQALQTQLELSLQGFQYKNQLILEQANKKTELENTYYGRYMDVLNQINTENAMAEQIRQFNQNYQFQLQQFNEQKRQYNQDYTESVRQFNEEIARLKAKDAQEQSLAEQQRQYNQSLAAQQSKSATITKSSSGSSSSGSSGGSISGNSGSYAVNTAYYQGSLNSDAKKYGTFSNGYQPKGISGYGTLSKTGKTIELNTQTLSGQKQTVVQNVWKTPDGSLWYWEGRQNKYIKISSGSGNGGAASNSSVNSGSGGGGRYLQHAYK